MKSPSKHDADLVHQLQAQVEHLSESVEDLSEQLEELRNQRQFFFASIGSAAVLIDDRGWVIEANASGLNLLDIHPDFKHKGLRVNLLRKLWRDDSAKLLALLNRDDMHSQEQHWIRAVRLSTDTLAERAFDLLVRLRRDRAGTRLALVVIHESTEQVLANRQAELCDALLRSSSDAIYAVGKNGTILFANDAAQAAFGSPNIWLEGKNRTEALMLPLSIHHKMQDERVERSEQPVRFIEQVLQHNGEAKHFNTTKFPVYSRDGDLIAIGTVSQDVTEDVQAQQLLELSEKVFRYSTDAIIVTDPEMRILRVNSAFERMTGWLDQDVRGKPVGIMRSQRHPETLYKFIWDSVTKLGEWSGEIVNRCADGREITVWLSISSLLDDRGKTLGFVGIQTDRSALKEAQQRIEQLTNYDALTGLPNRRLGLDRLERLIKQAARRGHQVGVLVIGIDHFKRVNDSFGHACGDVVLKKVGALLVDQLRSEDSVCRLMGDSFSVTLGETSYERAMDIADKLHRRLQSPIDLGNGLEYRPTVCIGIASYPEHSRDASQLLQHADTAMRAAKSAGRNRTMSFRADMSRAANWQLTLHNELPRALTRNEFQVFLQPKFDVLSGRLTGAEALVRWYRNGSPAPLLPGEYIWAIEADPILRQLDAWMLEQCIGLCSQWNKAKRLPEHFRIAINQTASDIEERSWPERIERLVAEAGINLSFLEVELTENVLATQRDKVMSSLTHLTSRGLSLAIDDFGTGYSNLAYLQQMPVSVIKIDQQFVRQLGSRRDAEVLIKSVIGLAHSLGHKVIAEGVETIEQLDLLRKLGCDQAQGFLLGRPVSADTFFDTYLQGAPIN